MEFETRELPGGVLQISAPVTTVDDLIEVASIDLDEWEVVDCRPNSWQSQTKDGEALTLYQIKATFRKRNILDPALLKSEIIEEIAAHSKPRNKIKRSRKKRNRALEVAIFDLHLGKFADAQETGADYSLDHASELFSGTVNDILAEVGSQSFDEIVFPIGNDFLHVDNYKGTTSNDTPQDVDSKLWALARRGRKMLVDAVDQLSELAPVTVITVPGNHDDVSTFFMGEILDAWYRRDSNVKVDSSPAPRKYYRFGNNLIGFTHGKYEGKRLPLLMAQEAKDWSDTKFREWHIGHVHHLSSKEDIGVRTRTIPSLAAPDTWHAKRGYVGCVRAAQCFIWDREYGLLATLEFPAAD